MDISARAFEFDISEPAARDRWRGRVLYTLITDRGGAFVAVLDGEIVGVAEAMVRERLWVLSLLAVDPSRQSAGAGSALLQAALSYRGNTSAGNDSVVDAALIVASDDPRALRLYRQAGFELRPTFDARGVLDAVGLGEPDPDIAVTGIDELESLAQLTREVRGAPLTGELAYALERGATIFRLTERGFVVAMPANGIWSLVARDEEAARRLLRRGLLHAAGPDPIRVRWITESQRWALALARELGMELTPNGALCVRGERGTLGPFLPSGPFA